MPHDPPNTPAPAPSPRARLIAIIEKLIGGKFYGSLTVKFQDGRPVHCDKNESIKLDGTNPRKG